MQKEVVRTSKTTAEKFRWPYITRATGKSQLSVSNLQLVNKCVDFKSFFVQYKLASLDSNVFWVFFFNNGDYIDYICLL